MKVLYIGDRRAGGIAGHVKCLTECLPPDVERYVIGVGGDEPFAGRNGHDIREFFQIRRVMRKFRPDVVHFNAPVLFMAFYVKIVRLFDLRLFDCLIGGYRKSSNRKSKNQTIAIICSWHTPTNRPPSIGQRLFFRLLGKDCYYLPVSTPTWEGLRRWLPYAKGEVFFNPMRIGIGDQGSGIRQSDNQTIKQSNNFTVGMVGRNADQKDWPAFHKVEELVKRRVSGFQGFKVSELQGFNPPRTNQSNNQTISNQTISSVDFLNAGEKSTCDGREAIAKMDLFVMTSKHEELPTTVLECFALGTPVCGFIPVGGMSDILKFSDGPLRGTFIAERCCEKLADIVMDLLAHPEKRQALVEDGRRILGNHFDAEKNCRGRLMEIYEKCSNIRTF